MATGRETVVNRALSGAELKQLLREDFDRLLEGEGLLSDYIAYGRVGYDITLRLHMDNFMRSESAIATASRPVGVNIVEKRPELAAVETPPLASSSSEAVTSGTRLAREITSPNAERIRAGLPVSVVVKQPDGTVTTEHIKYPPQSGAAENVRVEDVTPEVESEWGKGRAKSL